MRAAAAICYRLTPGCSYQVIHVASRTAKAAVTAHRVQREAIRPGAVGDAQLELKEETKTEGNPVRTHRRQQRHLQAPPLSSPPLKACEPAPGLRLEAFSAQEV